MIGPILRVQSCSVYLKKTFDLNMFKVFLLFVVRNKN